jgi:hypothetical protein
MTSDAGSQGDGPPAFASGQSRVADTDDCRPFGTGDGFIPDRQTDWHLSAKHSFDQFSRRTTIGIAL